MDGPAGGDDDPRHEPSDGIGEGTDQTDPDPGTAPRGWLPPDDRLWRHPSELSSGPPAADMGGASAGGASAGGRAGPGPRPAITVPRPARRRHRALATVLVGTGATAAVAVGLLVLLGASLGSGGTPVGSPSAARAATLTVVTGCCKVVPSAERRARSAMVSLQVTTAGGTTQDCGVVVGSDGLVATTLDAVAGARSLTAVTADGARAPVAVVGTDQTSDIALLRVGDDLPVARFAGATGAEAGRRAIVLAMASAGRRGSTASPPATMWTTGTIRSVDAAVARGDATGLAGIDADVGHMPDMAGEVLLQPDGQVIGILDNTGTPTGDRTTRLFLPAQLVVGVAEALASNGRVDHGWLDIEGATAPAHLPSTTTTTDAVWASSTPTTTTTSAAGGAGGGAMVLAVDPVGASADRLDPGDVIRSVDGQPVRSMAELRDRLYVLRPGTRVEVGVDRDGTELTVAVDLAASP